MSFVTFFVKAELSNFVKQFVQSMTSWKPVWEICKNVWLCQFDGISSFWQNNRCILLRFTFKKRHFRILLQFSEIENRFCSNLISVDIFLWNQISNPHVLTFLNILIEGRNHQCNVIKIVDHITSKLSFREFVPNLHTRFCFRNFDMFDSRNLPKAVLF